MQRALLVLLVSAFGLGCGAKTGLKVPPPAAGVPAAAIDMAHDLPDLPVALPEHSMRPEPDLCIELPPEEPPTSVDVSFTARVAQADVVFLIDVTGSMGGEIFQIQTTLRTVVVPALEMAVDDVQLAVAQFADFPFAPYGTPMVDVPYTTLLESTSDFDMASVTVARLRTLAGGDFSESHVQALFQVATNAPFRGIPRTDCPDGTLGATCLRRNSTPVVLLFTDAPMHNGPGGFDAYDPGEFFDPPASYEQAVEALNAIGAKVLGINSGRPTGLERRHLEQLAQDTGAVAEGEPLVLNISAEGEGLDEAVVQLVGDLVERVPLDVSVVAEDFPDDAFDAERFVRGVETRGAEPASGAVDLMDRFAEVQPGTEVRFALLLANELLPRESEPQSFFLTVVLLGDGVTPLRETLVEVVVPSIDGRGCDPPL